MVGGRLGLTQSQRRFILEGTHRLFLYLTVRPFPPHQRSDPLSLNLSLIRSQQLEPMPHAEISEGICHL